jgi:hypothetical protein
MLNTEIQTSWDIYKFNTKKAKHIGFQRTIIKFLWDMSNIFFKIHENGTSKHKHTNIHTLTNPIKYIK